MSDADSGPQSSPAPLWLGAAGRTLWDAVTSTYELSGDEVVVLGQACREADVVDELDGAIAELGPVDVESGRVRPLVASARAGRLAVAKLLQALDLPDEDGASVSPASQRGRKAAQTRWATQRALQGGRRGA